MKGITEGKKWWWFGIDAGSATVGGSAHDDDVVQAPEARATLRTLD